MAKVISFCNQKGGVGKTTTAVNLASCLAAAEIKTLLIDLDPQANATTGVGIDKNSVNLSIYQSLVTDDPVNHAIVKGCDIEYLDVIPSMSSLVGAELELVNTFSRENRLKEVLSPVLNDYNYILIDCPPSMGLLTINALTASNYIIIPVQCEYYAMEGLASLRKTIELVRKRLNSDLKIKGVLLTMFDPRNNLAHQVADEIRSHFNEYVFQATIPRNVKLSEAPSYGKPIISYDVKSKGALAYLDLANEILVQDIEIKEENEKIEREIIYATKEGFGEGTRLSD